VHLPTVGGAMAGREGFAYTNCKGKYLRNKYLEWIKITMILCLPGERTWNILLYYYFVREFTGEFIKYYGVKLRRTRLFLFLIPEQPGYIYLYNNAESQFYKGFFFQNIIFLVGRRTRALFNTNLTFFYFRINNHA